jgi:hypothetical protein
LLRRFEKRVESDRSLHLKEIDEEAGCRVNERQFSDQLEPAISEPATAAFGASIARTTATRTRGARDQSKDP